MQQKHLNKIQERYMQQLKDTNLKLTILTTTTITIQHTTTHYTTKQQKNLINLFSHYIMENKHIACMKG